MTPPLIVSTIPTVSAGSAALITSASLAGADGPTRASVPASPPGAGRLPLDALDVSVVALDPAASCVSPVPVSVPVPDLVLAVSEAVLPVSPPTVASLLCSSVVDEVVASLSLPAG
jgi:hypothetical protein